MAGSDRHVTTDHDEIRRWVEERGGRPAAAASVAPGGSAGILRIDFPDHDDSALEEISWEDFFNKFEEKNLAFIYQDHLKDGKRSRYSRFVTRGSVQA